MYNEYIEVVEETLEELDITDKKVLKVFNKIDKLKPQQIGGLRKAHPKAAFISAERGIGLNKLEDKIQDLIEENFVTKTMKIPAAKYEGVAFLHRVANIHSQEYVNASVKVTFSISEENLLRLNHMLDNVEADNTVAESN